MHQVPTNKLRASTNPHCTAQNGPLPGGAGRRDPIRSLTRSSLWYCGFVTRVCVWDKKKSPFIFNNIKKDRIESDQIATGTEPAAPELLPSGPVACDERCCCWKSAEINHPHNSHRPTHTHASYKCLQHDSASMKKAIIMIHVFFSFRFVLFHPHPRSVIESENQTLVLPASNTLLSLFLFLSPLRLA